MGEDRHRVVVVGGGFGGLNVTRGLAKAPVDVTIVDKTNHHLFQPLLYEVATGILSEGLIAPALRSILKRQNNARAILAEVTEIDLTDRIVTAVTPIGERLKLPYDSLVVAGGATHAYFGHDEWSAYAPGMKSLEDARRLRSHILGAFEMAELATDSEARDAWLTFVVLGAGPTGVEISGQLAELAHRVLPRDYRSIDTREARILLIDAAPAVLGSFPVKLQQYTKSRLERGWASRSDSTSRRPTWTTTASRSRVPTVRNASRRTPRNGRPVCTRRRLLRCSPRRRARRSIEPGGSRSSRTAAFLGTPACSRSVTWSR
jgi:NADH dehydrogenase